MKQERIDIMVLDIYRELYLKATPSANFDELMANAPLNELGQKIIKYLDYEIEDGVMDEIIEKHLKKHKVPVYQRSALRASIYLGCSPKSKKD